jgi:type II secretory pathway component PulM
MQFERDSQTLEQKMRKRKCMMRAMIGGMILLVLVIAWWIFVL